MTLTITIALPGPSMRSQAVSTARHALVLPAAACRFVPACRSPVILPAGRPLVHLNQCRAPRHVDLRAYDP